MAIKKSELYSSLWSGCDELRGGMDASQYKDYVLVLLFIKYVSDKYACIIVIDKENAHTPKGIFMIDASSGYLKDGNKNRLRGMDIHQIVDVFNKRLELAKYSRMVGVEEIEKNEFNLNIPRYIDSQSRPVGIDRYAELCITAKSLHF